MCVGEIWCGIIHWRLNFQVVGGESGLVVPGVLVAWSGVLYVFLLGGGWDVTGFGERTPEHVPAEGCP